MFSLPDRILENMNIGHHPILSLFRYIRNYQKLITWSCINSILNKILDLMPPLLVGWVIDSVTVSYTHLTLPTKRIV